VGGTDPGGRELPAAMAETNAGSEKALSRNGTDQPL
jgi:hypothetical protein